MAKEVILTPTALSDFDNVIEYLTFKWGMSVTNDFIERFDKVVSFIGDDSGMFPFFDKGKQLQRCVLTKHNIMYFKETEQVVLIFTIFDTRQNPEKLNPLI
jgi:plasmid stabilization system protein ParE